MFIVGIDIAKRSHEAIIIAEDGQVVRKAFSFRNNCTGYNLLLEQVRRLTLVKSQIVFAMESTAHYWLALYARLLKDGYTVMVLNPIQSHSLRELYIPQGQNRRQRLTHHCGPCPLWPLQSQQRASGQNPGSARAVPQPRLSGRHGR